MWLLRALLDRIVLLAGVCAAGCVPGFITQYRQRLDGRLEQVLMDLEPFQAIADREHHGSLQALIDYHLQSADTTFHGEGEALQRMVQAAAQLRAMAAGLNADLAHQFLYLLMHPDSALLRGTWSDYHPSFALDLQGIAFALVVGVTLWAMFMLIWHGVARLLRSRTGPRLRREGRPS